MLESSIDRVRIFQYRILSFLKLIFRATIYFFLFLFFVYIITVYGTWNGTSVREREENKRVIDSLRSW